jgi:hypothetical protein
MLKYLYLRYFCTTAVLQHNRSQKSRSASLVTSQLAYHTLRTNSKCSTLSIWPRLLVSRRWDGNRNIKRFEKPRRRNCKRSTAFSWITELWKLRSAWLMEFKGSCFCEIWSLMGSYCNAERATKSSPLPPPWSR